jgi:ferric-dicitrate binding protein FerR (iron transport regulator)
MIQQTTNHTPTDRAWDLLYARLLHDGLIEPPPAAKPAKRFILSPARPAIVATAALCLISLAAWMFLRQMPEDERGSFLTLRNEKGAVTLVTTLEDGSIVYLADDTRLHYPEHFPADVREVELSGRAMFHVQGSSERPFRIKTHTARIEVTGTWFDVISPDSRTFELAVREGEVKATLARSGRWVYAEAGQTLALSAEDGFRIIPTPDAGRFDRYGAQLRFKDETLGNILRVINQTRRSDVFLHTTPALENKKITVTFTNDNPDSVTELICAAFGLTCRKERNNWLISEP